MEQTHSLSVRDLTKIFDTDQGAVRAVDGVNFEIAGAEFFTMLGPSGCGKTTTLRMVAGLEDVTSGSIEFDGRDFARQSTFRRNIGMVFQSYALFPHMTVFENVAYGLRIRKMAELEIRERIARILKLLGLDELAERHPADLSGGQQQRVSIARALVYDPGMLLLDEPLANLDAKLRVEMREEIRRIQKELDIMSIYVTHDQEEAMSVSDRVAVFNLGRLMQLGPPADVYADPQSLFVADFIGKANFLPALLVGRDSASAKVAIGAQEMVLHRMVAVPPEEENQLEQDASALVMVRPEHVELAAESGDGLPGRVRRIQFLGSFVRYVIDCPLVERELIVDARRAVARVVENGGAKIRFAADEAILFHRRGIT